MGAQVASVGRMVHYFDREEIVNADQQKRRPEPFAAVVTRVHKDQEGKVLDVVNLSVFDPEIGNQVKRDVRLGEKGAPEANRWYWPPYQVAPPTSGSTVEIKIPEKFPAGDEATKETAKDKGK